MKKVNYAGGSFISGDRIVDAVARFATANANADRSSELEIPAVDVDGHRQMIGIIVGPASQLFFEPATSGHELEDEEFVSRLEQKTRQLNASSRVDPT
jgi:hypothetical protein